LEGRFGPYVTDGVTNASLPRSVTVEEMTLDYALTLLKDRAAAGPSKRGRKKAAPKKTTRKTAKKPAKKTAKKKTPKKASPKKAVKKSAIEKAPAVEVSPDEIPY
jgi:DNA topoisomerase I